MTSDTLRIANCSGFYGDRLSAAREMVEGGPIDVLTGDYLAELTMLILWKSRERDSSLGYAATFYTQMEEVLATCIERGIKVVTNAGGLNPRGLAARLRELAQKMGISARIAHVEGDDVLDRVRALEAHGNALSHMDTGAPISSAPGPPVSANAYLGGFPIAAALGAGADVVVTGRVTDASLVVGPAAWRFGWEPRDLDQLAGAVVAGHVIECGAQTTGGNYSFFEEVPGIEHPGFPIAEMHEDGSAVITKHPGTGGRVSVGTVTAQLLYEIAGPRYDNPDATADFSTIYLSEEGPDRVRIDGVKGTSPPEELKVSINLLGGWRNTATFVITGLDVEEKAALLVRSLGRIVADGGGFEAFADHDLRLIRSDKEDAYTNEQASAQLRVTVKDADREAVGRRFSSAAVELALSNYPGLYLSSPPTDASAYGVYWPTLISRDDVEVAVVHDDGSREVLSDRAAAGTGSGATAISGTPNERAGSHSASADEGATRTAPLGSVAGARSGDKGPNANVGLWTRTDAGFRWLRGFLTTDRFKSLLTEAAALDVDRYELDNLRALNFVVRGLLGEGVASSTRPDPQAKSLGEYLRSRMVEVPVSVLEEERRGANGWTS